MLLTEYPYINIPDYRDSPWKSKYYYNSLDILLRIYGKRKEIPSEQRDRKHIEIQENSIIVVAYNLTAQDSDLFSSYLQNTFTIKSDYINLRDRGLEEYFIREDLEWIINPYYDSKDKGF